MNKTIHQFKSNHTTDEVIKSWELASAQMNDVQYKLWTAEEISTQINLPYWVAEIIIKCSQRNLSADALIGHFLLFEFGGCYVPMSQKYNPETFEEHWEVSYKPLPTGIIFGHKQADEISLFIVNTELKYLREERNNNQQFYNKKYMRNELYTASPEDRAKSHTYSHKFLNIPARHEALDGILINSDNLLSRAQFSVGNLDCYSHFNGSICEFNGHTLFAYRMECLKNTKDVSWFNWIALGLTELDKNTFEPSLRFRTQIKLNAPSKKLPDALQGRQRINVLKGDHWEDPRLFTLNNGKELWLCFTNGYEIGFAQLMVDFKKNRVIPRHQFICESPGEKSMDRDRREKNWTAFDRNGELWIHYQFSPQHIIYQLDKQTGSVLQTIKHDTPDFAIIKEKNLFGSLRGGTPCIPLNSKYDITMFHGNKKHFGSNYYTYTAGFLLFERTSGKIVHCSDIMIKPSAFPNLIPRPSQSAVVFPAGLVNDGTYLTISAGINDYDSFIYKFKIDDVIPKEFLC